MVLIYLEILMQKQELEMYTTFDTCMTTIGVLKEHYKPNSKLMVHHQKD